MSVGIFHSEKIVSKRKKEKKRKRREREIQSMKVRQTGMQQESGSSVAWIDDTE